MRSVRGSAPQLANLVPYDPKYLPAEAFLSANENPHDVDQDIRHEIMREVKRLPLNRYPDPLANDLRDMIAEANGLDRDQVLVGNGGDELLFDMALAWGGPGRTFLNLPPTFSVYDNNARLTGTTVVDVPRCADYSIDEDAVLARVAQGDIDYLVVTSPNNPTGQLASEAFILKLLDCTDALVMVDEAYFEFSRQTMRPYLDRHKNLVILRTLSKAFALAGLRCGFTLASADIINVLMKVIAPYPLSSPVAAIAAEALLPEGIAVMQERVTEICRNRQMLCDELQKLPLTETVFPSKTNYILVRFRDAERVFRSLWDEGIILRDQRKQRGLENCLRITVGTRAECLRVIAAIAALEMP